MKKVIITLILFISFISSTVYAEYRKIDIALAFQEPLSKEIEILLDELNTVLKQLKPYADNITSSENTTKTHICKHDTGGACVEEKELTEEVFVKPTPTPSK